MSAGNLQLTQLAFSQLSAKDRAAFIRDITGQPAAREPDRLLRPREAAARLGVTTRTVFSLLKTGALNRIHLPGRTRALGVRNSEIEALIRGAK